MKKGLFAILTTIVLGAAFMVSCGDEPDPTPPVPPIDKETNQKILKVMQDNYLWTVPANPNINQETKLFFGSLLNGQNDRYTETTLNGNLTLTYSRISEKSNQPSTVYDAGFEYAINTYVSGVVYYVVLYVKPGTPAANWLARGMYITKVNGTTVTRSNAQTLLPSASAKGGDLELSIRTPAIITETVVKFGAVANYTEAPMLTSSILAVGGKKVGYITYNNFSQGSNYNYDNTLAAKLTQFKNEGVSILVFDVRYNSSGILDAAQVIGSAVVKNRDTSKAFIQQLFRADLPTPVRPLNFLDNTKGGVAIPKLGDQLDRIYIITGKSTAGVSEAFINAIKAYRSSDITLIGEKSKGMNVITAPATENGKDPGNWNLRLAYLYPADVNKNYNFSAGFTPNETLNEVEVAANQKILLGELGTDKEIILSKILYNIANNIKSTSVLETRSSVVNSELKTSLDNRPGANVNSVELY